MKKYNVYLTDSTVLRNALVEGGVDSRDACVYNVTTETGKQILHESVIARFEAVTEPTPTLPKPTTRKTSNA